MHGIQEIFCGSSCNGACAVLAADSPGRGGRPGRHWRARHDHPLRWRGTTSRGHPLYLRRRRHPARATATTWGAGQCARLAGRHDAGNGRSAAGWRGADPCLPPGGGPRSEARDLPSVRARRAGYGRGGQRSPLDPGDRHVHHTVVTPAHHRVRRSRGKCAAGRCASPATRPPPRACRRRRPAAAAPPARAGHRRPPPRPIAAGHTAAAGHPRDAGRAPADDRAGQHIARHRPGPVRPELTQPAPPRLEQVELPDHHPQLLRRDREPELPVIIDPVHRRLASAAAVTGTTPARHASLSPARRGPERGRADGMGRRTSCARAQRDGHQDRAVRGDVEAVQAGGRGRYRCGVPAVRAPRVTVQPPAAPCCPLMVVAQIWQAVPAGMPLTLASRTVPRAQACSARPRRPGSPGRTLRPPRPTRAPWPGAAARRAAAVAVPTPWQRRRPGPRRLPAPPRRRHRGHPVEQPVQQPGRQSGGIAAGTLPDSCRTARGTLRSRAGSPASPAISSGTGGTTPGAAGYRAVGRSDRAEQVDAQLRADPRALAAGLPGDLQVGELVAVVVPQR